jgi:DNA-binding response OmpR family regulator
VPTHTSRRAPAVEPPRIDLSQRPEGVSLADDVSVPHLALVVDDEPLVRRFISSVLRREGWTVLEAADATAALAMADRKPLDLLVTDYEMPRVSGVTLAEQLRARHRDLPVLVISGYPDVDYKMRSLRGKTAFTCKPFAAADLVASVGALVG